MTRIGAHVEQQDPIAEARARETDLVQFFLGDPQGYKGPEVRYAGGLEGLRDDAAAAAAAVVGRPIAHSTVDGGRGTALSACTVLGEVNSTASNAPADSSAASGCGTGWTTVR